MSLVKNLFKDYGDFSLHIDEFEIRDTGVTALIGPSGSGKSSCLRVLLGTDSCPSLEWIHGKLKMHELVPPYRHIGMVFQSYEIFPHLTGFENIEFAARARKMEKTEFRERLQTFEETLNLSGFAHRKGHLLSGGEKQRIALARALITRPRFLFLDEPFASLDIEYRTSARELVKNIVAKESIPTLLVTHDQEDLKALADHKVRINKGRLVDSAAH